MVGHPILPLHTIRSWNKVWTLSISSVSSLLRIHAPLETKSTFLNFHSDQLHSVTTLLEIATTSSITATQGNSRSKQINTTNTQCKPKKDLIIYKGTKALCKYMKALMIVDTHDGAHTLRTNATFMSEHQWWWCSQLIMMLPIADDARN